MTWEVLKGHSLDEDLDFVKSAVQRAAVPGGTFTAEQAVFALRIVARSLARKRGVQPEQITLTALSYDQEVLALRVESASSRRGSVMRLPDSQYVARLLKVDFDQACRQAGIGYGSRRRWAATRAEVLELCLEEFGTLAGQRDLNTFARARGISMQAGSHTRAIAEMRARRDAAGKDTPRDFPPRDERPDYSLPAAEQPDWRRRNQHGRSPESVLAEAVEFLTWLESLSAPRGLPPTTAAWDHWGERLEREGRPRTRAAVAARNYPGGFAQLIADAYDALLPEHLREREPQDSDGRVRNIRVPGDERFDYDRPLVEHLSDKRTPSLLPMLAYAHQHGPVRRKDFELSLNIGPAGTIRNVRRLLGLGALKSVKPLPDDDGRVKDRLVIGPAVTGEALEIVRSHAEIVKADPGVNKAHRLRDRADAQALKILPSVLREDGTFMAQDFARAYAEAYDMTRATGLNRVASLVAGGYAIKETMPPELAVHGQRFRYRFVERPDPADGDLAA